MSLRSPRFLPCIAAASGLLLTAATIRAQDGAARYEVEFESTWSASTHPNQYPSNPHYSPLIGGTHDASAVLWQVGGTATLGIERMAELGSTTNLRSEVQAAINAGSADQILQFGGLGNSPQARFDEFTITAKHSRVTLVSMLAPSPDWFVGVSGLDLRPNGKWADTVIVPLQVWDAGTDSGISYNSPNANTSPKDPISGVSTTSGPFQGQSKFVGFFVFTRKASSSVYGCGVNPDGSMIAGAPPLLGTNFTFEVHDPTGQLLTAPANAGLLLSAQPDANFPCGSPINGLSLTTPGSPGELLLQPVILAVPLPPWTGAPLATTLSIPNDPSLSGLFLYLQVGLIDGGGAYGGLTNALELKFGS